MGIRLFNYLAVWPNKRQFQVCNYCYKALDVSGGFGCASQFLLDIIFAFLYKVENTNLLYFPRYVAKENQQNGKSNHFAYSKSVSRNVL